MLLRVDEKGDPQPLGGKNLPNTREVGTKVSVIRHLFTNSRTNTASDDRGDRKSGVHVCSPKCVWPH